MANVGRTENENKGKSTWFDLENKLKWKPTSRHDLVVAESKMFEFVRSTLDKFYVVLKNGNQLWTVAANKSVSDKIPLVMVHGFAGGVGLWSQNIDALAEQRSVYMFDLLGFGKSSRCKFASSATDVEDQFVQSIEDWRQVVNIDEMVLLGHSFGGYLVSCYALRYPDRVRSLVLVDPWGFPLNSSNESPFKQWRKALYRVLKAFIPLGENRPAYPWEDPHLIQDGVVVMSVFNPLKPIRGAGPWGPELLKKFRWDFKDRFPEISRKDENAVFDYLFHCNAQKPTGELAFKVLNQNFGFAYRPMLSRIAGIRKTIPVTFIFGEKSWIDSHSGYATQLMLTENKVCVHEVVNAGHHVYADNAKDFNCIVKSLCDALD